MGDDFAVGRQRMTTAETFMRIADQDGSISHPHLRSISIRSACSRDLSDAIHGLCAVHGDTPSIIDVARDRLIQPETADWLNGAAENFAAEREYLARLTAAAGPVPSTAGQAETETALTAIRSTFETLAGSERCGCATGAVVALMVEWLAIRWMLDVAAIRFGIASPPLALPPDSATADAIEIGGTPGCARAMAFGASQVFAQHRGLWNLLAARREARGSE